MPKPKRPSKKPARTAIVPRIVFQTVIAVSVVPAAGGAVAGCGGGGVAAVRDAAFSVADGSGVAAWDARFSVAADGGQPADAGLFSVAIMNDAGGFSVADVGAPDPDAGLFSVAVEPSDAG